MCIPPLKPTSWVIKKDLKKPPRLRPKLPHLNLPVSQQRFQHSLIRQLMNQV